MTGTIFPDLEAALEARVQALSSETEIAWEGISYAPRKGRPYLAVQTAARQRSPMALGPQSPHLWVGTWSFRVVHPAEEGKAIAYQRAKTVLDWFPRALTLVYGGAKIVVESGSIQPAYPTADWLNIPVTVSWFTEEAP